MKVSEKDYQLYSSRVAWYYFKTGMTQAEIAEKLKTSQQVIGYHLKKLKDQSKKKGTDSLFCLFHKTL